MPVWCWEINNKMIHNVQCICAVHLYSKENNCTFAHRKIRERSELWKASLGFIQSARTSFCMKNHWNFLFVQAPRAGWILSIRKSVSSGRISSPRKSTRVPLRICIPGTIWMNRRFSTGQRSPCIRMLGISEILNTGTSTIYTAHTW